MHKLLVYLFIPIFIFSCKGEEPNENIDPIPEVTGIEFSTFEEKISYCIGFDHAFAINQVYNGENTQGKFSIPDLEQGLRDYLGDADLRVSISSIDSILNLYLGDNGEVDESFVSKEDASYALGLVEAQTLVGSMVGRGIDQTMDVQFLQLGITDGMYNSQKTLSLTEIKTEVSNYYSEMNRKMGESFLSQNAQNEGVITTESGLQYEIIEKGTGIKPNLTDSCIVHYTGRFIDGRVFETTIPSGKPIGFTPLGVIPGWKEGLLLMNEGGSSRFFVPYNLGYGEARSGPIEPYSTLVFDIELIRVKRFQP